MSTTTYMLLTLPTPGTTNDFTGEQQEVAAFQTIDAHDHSIGKGTYVTPAGLLINTDLPFGSNNATLLRSVRFSNNSVALSLTSDIGCAFVAGGDLYYRNVNGQTVQITSGGSIVAGAQGNITGLAVPAAVNYNSSTGTYSFISNSNRAAIVDAGPVVVRDTASSALGITLQSPSGLVGAYSLTLPAALPASNGLLQVTTSGVLSAFGTVSGNNLALAGNLTVSGNQTFSGNAVTVISTSVSNGQVNLLGNRTAGAVGVADIAIGAQQNRSAGFLVVIQNNNGGSNALFVDYQGLLSLGVQSTPIQPSSIYTTASSSGAWVNTSLSYWKDACGVVRLKGAASTLGFAPVNPVFTLPAGFRPTSTRIFPCWSTISNAFVNAQVATNGQVSLSVLNTGDAYYLDTVAFAAEA